MWNLEKMLAKMLSELCDKKILPDSWIKNCTLKDYKEVAELYNDYFGGKVY